MAIFGIYARFCGEWWHREPLGQFWGLVSVGLCVAPSGGGVAPRFYQKMVSPNIATLPKIQKTFCAQKMDFLSIGQKDAQRSQPGGPTQLATAWVSAWLHRAVAWLQIFKEKEGFFRYFNLALNPKDTLCTENWFFEHRPERCARVGFPPLGSYQASLGSARSFYNCFLVFLNFR